MEVILGGEEMIITPLLCGNVFAWIYEEIPQSLLNIK